MNNNKKLYRVNEGKVIGGVCAGFAEYLEIDVTLIRVAWAVLALCGGCGLIAYIVALFIMPIKPSNM